MTGHDPVLEALEQARNHKDQADHAIRVLLAYARELTPRPYRLADLAGSRLIDLDILEDEEAAELFTRIIGPERSEAEPEAVGQVLAACAGLPLAIRVCAARLATRSEIRVP